MFPFHASALLLALLLDWFLGDPPNRFHPTAWMGSFIHTVFRKRPSNNAVLEFLFGMGIIVTGTVLFGAIGYGLATLFSRLPIWVGVLLEAILLKTTFSLHGLWKASEEIQTALENSNLPEAQRLLSWHLVSRDTSQLDEAHVAAATIESLAENASDSLVAPLFFYAIGGLPLVIIYRFVNTADAMLGYRDPVHEWIGKFPARLDDLLNYLTARLTGILIVVGTSLRCDSNSGSRAWRTLRQDARKTESPNAGYPMSAMAGALNVELEKAGVYRLGEGNPLPAVQDIRKARLLLLNVSLLTAVILLSIIFLIW